MTFNQELSLFISALSTAIGCLYLLSRLHDSRPQIQLTILANSVTSFNLGTNMTQATVLSTITINASYVDSKGNPAVPATAPVWSVDNALASVVAAPDGLSAVVTPVGPVGTVVVTATAGSVVGTASIELTAGPAAEVVLATTVTESAAL